MEGRSVAGMSREHKFVQTPSPDLSKRKEGGRSGKDHDKALNSRHGQAPGREAQPAGGDVNNVSEHLEPQPEGCRRDQAPQVGGRHGHRYRRLALHSISFLAPRPHVHTSISTPVTPSL